MIQVKKLGKHLGAEISGVDLSKPLDDDTFAQVSKAFFDNEVVVFRGQKLTPEQQIAFTRRFGVLEQHVRKESRLPGYPEILVGSNLVKDDGTPIGTQDAGRFWHSDLSYKREPSLLSALYALEVPVKNGKVLGDTEFASTTAAYEEGGYEPTAYPFFDRPAPFADEEEVVVDATSRLLRRGDQASTGIER